MSLEEVESIISDVDVNKDGKLDYNEVYYTCIYSVTMEIY